MLKAKDFREQARKALNGKWGQAVIAGAIAGIMGGNILYTGFASSSATSTAESTTQLTWEVVLMMVALIAFIGAVVFLVGSIVGLGYAKFNLALYKDEPVDFKMIFSERSRYKDCFALFFMQWLTVTVGTALFVVPGLMAYYGQKMAAYIMVENPEMSAKEALAACRAMMKGNKWRLFCLTWSFIGWDILATLTLGLGNFLVCPYVEAAGAAFYNEIKASK